MRSSANSALGSSGPSSSAIAARTATAHLWTPGSNPAIPSASFTCCNLIGSRDTSFNRSLPIIRAVSSRSVTASACCWPAILVASSAISAARLEVLWASTATTVVATAAPTPTTTAAQSATFPQSVESRQIVIARFPRPCWSRFCHDRQPHQHRPESHKHSARPAAMNASWALQVLSARPTFRGTGYAEAPPDRSAAHLRRQGLPDTCQSGSNSLHHCGHRDPISAKEETQ